MQAKQEVEKAAHMVAAVETVEAVEEWLELEAVKAMKAKPEVEKTA